MLKKRGSRVRTSVWPIFFQFWKHFFWESTVKNSVIMLLIDNFGMGQSSTTGLRSRISEGPRAFAGSALSECHFLVLLLKLVGNFCWRCKTNWTRTVFPNKQNSFSSFVGCNFKMSDSVVNKRSRYTHQSPSSGRQYTPTEIICCFGNELRKSRLSETWIFVCWK